MKLTKDNGKDLTKEELHYVLDNYIYGPWLIEDTATGKRIIVENFEEYELYMKDVYNDDPPPSVKASPLIELGPAARVLYGKENISKG